jgi:RNA polymerase sigma-70 factor (ECF subfamily)
MLVAVFTSSVAGAGTFSHTSAAGREECEDMDLTAEESLLDRLRRDGARRDWERFVDLYCPLLEFWARQLLRGDDAADLLQDVLLLVMQKLASFAGEENRTFLAWLRALMLNRWRDLGRRAAARPGTCESVALEAVAGEDALAEVAASEDRNFLIRRALQIMQSDFEPTTWRACWESVANDRPAAEVAVELGVTVDVVYSATYRVLKRLRSELPGGWE